MILIYYNQILNIFLFNTFLLFTGFKLPQHFHGIVKIFFEFGEYFLMLSINGFLDTAACYDGISTESFHTFTSDVFVLLLAYQHTRSSKFIAGNFY